MGYVSVADQPKGCIFCHKSQLGSDEENHILYRGEQIFLLLNTFPYNTGHIMAAPYRHTGDPLELAAAEAAELLHGVGLAIKTLKAALSPEGFNIGANIGHVAGAGFAEHLHIHVVPRWSGDTNFMAVTAATRVVPEALDETYRRLKAALPNQDNDA